MTPENPLPDPSQNGRQNALETAREAKEALAQKKLDQDNLAKDSLEKEKLAKEAVLLYETGKRLYLAPGAACDGHMAAAYFERAGLLGHAPAQRVLGIMLLEGDQVEKNPLKAAKWLSAAADSGDLQACFTLALMYARGDGVTKDWSRAHELLTKPGIAALPEATELRRRLRSELVALYPELAKALSGRESLYRASLDKTQGRRIPLFLDPAGDVGDREEFAAWLDLNLGRLTAEEALDKLTRRMDGYYRGLAGASPGQGKTCP